MMILMVAIVLLALGGVGYWLATGPLADSETSDPAGSTGLEPPTGAVLDYSVQPGTATDGYVGARSDVADLECSARAGGIWQAQGVVTNPTTDIVDYRIYVAFLTGPGDTRGIVQLDVSDVDPQEARTWDGELAIPGADDLRCVLRVERTG
jgi:hypothetical protein